MHKIREMKQYPPIYEIFAYYQDEEDIVFLDSSLQNQLGHYSIVARKPYLKLVQGKQFTVNGVVQDRTFEEYIRQYLSTHPDPNETELPIVSGAVGYLTYDYGRKKEGVVSGHPREVDMPDAVFCFYDSFIIEDHQKKQLFIIANGQTEEAELLLERTAGEIQALCDKTGTGRKTDETEDEVRISPNFTRSDYMQAVDDMISYIIEGDIYIANMTQHLTIESRKPPCAVFRDLRKHNPSPFGGFLNYGDLQIVCASPERFLQMRDRHVETRPIKGTRKRGATPQEDCAMRQELADSEKDKSELLMIVDLERNDLNRVCVPGSVKVTEMYTVEEYATVFHLISNVEGRLREDCNVMDLLESAFPGGSITGAPKLRAMEIIDELEHGRRNLYTGSIGYFTLDGDCDFNIVIRTAVYKDGTYYLGVGGGITYESDLAFEYEETLQKAKAVLEALGAKKVPVGKE